MSEPTVAEPPPPFTPGVLPNLRFDLLAGFLVFLIALPLCLGIAQADHYPAIAGIWTAVLGGLICSFLSNSQMTIKGPAAGLIVIVLGSMDGFEADIRADRTAAAVAAGKSAEVAKQELDTPEAKAEVRAQAYRYSIAVGVVAGVLQVLLALARAGALVDFFPMTPIHGLLASIGIVIMFKQAYTMLGLAAPGGEALQSVIQLPGTVAAAFGDPDRLAVLKQVAPVGLTSLAILIAYSLTSNKAVRAVPVQVIVLAVAVPLGFAFYQHLDLAKFRVNMPDVLGDPSSAFAVPDFGRVPTATGMQYVVLFTLIGSLESAVSAKAVDLIDPYRRKTDMNRDLLAVGVANALGAAAGALPMISEIVRSKANIDNGARTSMANFFHGVFLLVAALFLTAAIALIPNAALGAMLVFTGFRLAHPREFLHAWQVGREQFLVFVVTIGVILATDLLIGFAAGIALELVFLVAHGVSPGRMMTAEVVVVDDDAARVVAAVRGPVVFSNWLPLRAKLAALGTGKDLVVDLAGTTFVDNSVMEKLTDWEREGTGGGHTFAVRGLGGHRPLAGHKLSARKRRADAAAG